ncbi:M24 family metallopeptidase [Inquilinus limosus]|uniref:M24 family metallopeptidase n=1 Tax=Inquilinus limosus TaxID=171674 RepID=UPI0003F7EBDD|nr:Xaa-Pro peptidase family protein [Inquilinus limosus]
MFRPDAHERAAKIRRRLFESAAADLDAVIGLTPESVTYLSGYRSMAHDTDRHHAMAAVATRERCLLVAPAVDFGPALEVMPDAGDIRTYGRFRFDSEPGAPRLPKPFGSFAAALADGLASLGRIGVVGLDEAPGGSVAAAVAAACPGLRFESARGLLLRARSVKLPEEVELLARATEVAERSLMRALAAAKAGMTEWELAAAITHGIVSGGGVPGFVVVTSGERSALADAYPSHRHLRPGDLVRLDIGCTVDGYWADMARTAFVGTPDARVRRTFAAIDAGTRCAVEQVKAGMTAGDLFDRVVAEVRQRGLPEFERHHVGHGLGLECFEHPVLSPRSDAVLERGMVLCLEAPLYTLGWGGMMVEETLVLDDDRVRMLTRSTTGLIPIPE